MTRTAAILQQLRRYESRNVTFLSPNGAWPIVWARAKGSQVWDVEGRRYLDLTAAFGVAAAGHANPRVVRAGQRQMATLLHAMGDVHPHELKVRLAAELSRLTFGRWSKPGRRGSSSRTGKVIFCNSGFEAVEAALKTCLLATRRAGVVAFEGAYHGLGYGALNATSRAHFRRPFLSQLRGFTRFVPFPTQAKDLTAVRERLEGLLRSRRFGAVLVEPVQGRGGIRVPPPGFLPMVRKLCDERGALLVLDEIYTGLGRTGAWFACEHSRTVPDVICLGKALTGGFPLSACVGRAELMDAAWPESAGEAIHTSTYLGHPVGCAMALAQLAEIRRRQLIDRSARLGRRLRRRLRVELRELLAAGEAEIRGIGLMAGVALRCADGSPATQRALTAVSRMLERGFILLPEGDHSEVIGLTPPLVISGGELDRTTAALREVLTEGSREQGGGRKKVWRS